MNDELLKALGKLAREQNAQDPPAELLQPPPASAKEKIVAQAVATFGKQPQPRLERRARPRWWLAVLAPAALAAAAAAVLIVDRGHAPLPAYALEARGGHAELRGESVPPALVLERGAPLNLVLRPATAAEGEVAARVFLVAGEQHVVWTPAEQSTSAQGAIRLSGVLAAIPAPGPGRIVVTVGRPASLPGTLSEVDPKSSATVTHPVSFR